MFANQFNGLATRAATVQVSTGVNAYEYRTASVANGGTPVPNSVAIRDANGSLHAAEFIGAVDGEAATAAKWAAPITLTLDGDVSGSASFDGSTGVTLSVTASSNSVALGTDTTGTLYGRPRESGSAPFDFQHSWTLHVPQPTMGE